MRTPEEIKKGLECCSFEYRCPTDCRPCPYVDIKPLCEKPLLRDALAYIRQLEAQISEANGKIEARDKEIDRMSLAFAKQTREVAEYKLFLLKSVENATGPLRKWISVKERLPKEYSLVWIYTAGSKQTKAKFYDNVWHGKGGAYRNVTHWMPLPEPPKEG